MKSLKSGSLMEIAFIALLVAFLGYAIVGTDSNVAEIRKLAPKTMAERNWEILRYEGYQYGSFGNHGGKVWYHVRNIDDHSIQYRVYVTMWKGELQYVYGKPETLNRINIDMRDN